MAWPPHKPPAHEESSEQETEESGQETSSEEEEVAKPVPATALAPKRRAPPPPPQSPVKMKRVPMGKDVAKNMAATKAAASSGAGREPDEMGELYPLLAEEVKALQKEHPGMFKREFGMMDDSKARALEEKIKKQKFSQMMLHMDLAE